MTLLILLCMQLHLVHSRRIPTQRGCLARGAGVRCDFSSVGGTMECCPKAVIGALALQMSGQFLCLGGIINVGVYEWAVHLVHSKILV